MEIPHAEHNSRNSVRRLTCSKLKCYTGNAHPKRNIGSAKRGEPSEAKSGTSTFAPLLTTAIIFKRIGSHDRYRKRGLHLPMDENKLVKVQKKCKDGI